MNNQLRNDELTINDLSMRCNEWWKLALLKAYTQRKPPQMGEEESGELKTPLKQRSFIKLYTMCLKEHDPRKDFEDKGKVTLQKL